ncbi:MAG: FAD-dependent oxidoreductase [Eubacteriales bacterium]|nr:FAD-dependent oxidoreductase [Eubacteriales bacterium]
MHKKILIVGGVAGGASAAARLRRLDSEAEIIMFERGEHVSFSNCALPYHLSGTVADSRSLVLMTPERFLRQHEIQVRVHCEVTSVSPKEKLVAVRNVITGETYSETYDKLVLSPGANPVLPESIRGIHRPHVFSVRNVADITGLKAYMEAHKVKKAAVIGGGFIGVEIAENLTAAGVSVVLAEAAPQIMAPFDYDMVQTLHKEMMDHGVSLQLSSSLSEIREHTILLKQGERELELEAELVVMAIGVRPEVTLAREAGLVIGITGGIQVNHNGQTSDPDIYAVGDAAESFHRLLAKPGRLALAGPAQKQARAAADHICGRSARNSGFIGSSCVRIFNQNAACTGLSEQAARAAGIPCGFALVYPPDKVSLMPDSHYMGLKLVFELPTGRLLGAQAIGQGSADKRIDVIASLISMGGTLEDLKDVELCYSPVFGTARDVVNQAALVGLNILEARFRQVPVSQVRQLVESGAYIVDVREPGEYAAGHLLGSVNIPLSQLKERMGEIPKDIPVYLHCRTGQRSYYAICRLQGRGWTNLFNISGSFLGVSLYEYFNDKSQGRTPVLTAYQFN